MSQQILQIYVYDELANYLHLFYVVHTSNSFDTFRYFVLFQSKCLNYNLFEKPSNKMWDLRCEAPKSTQFSGFLLSTTLKKIYKKPKLTTF